MTPERRRVLAAVAERILPSVDLGDGEETPGAREAGVAPYVERVLATRLGLAPWRAPIEEGLDRLDEWARDGDPARTGAGYADLPAAEQDILLRRLQEGSGPRGRACVDRLVRLCLEGFLRDPAGPTLSGAEGGNRNGAGWRAVGLPADGSWKGPAAARVAEVGGESPPEGCE